jgi:RNA polymerase sigma factor (sigma-70 family)
MKRSAPSQGEHVELLPAAEAQEVLIEAYGKLIFHLIYSLTGNWEESQDLTQETFLQALQAIDAARATSGTHFHAKAWLVRIAINTVRMHQRRQRILRFVPFSQFEGEQTDAEELDTPSWLGAAAPVQPAGCGASGGENPAEVIAERESAPPIAPLHYCWPLAFRDGAIARPERGSRTPTAQPCKACISDPLCV